MILPLVICFPLIRLSRLVIVWPDSLNTPHKDWWLATPARLNRIERLVREDLIVFATLLLLGMTCGDVAILRAAHRPGGTRSPAEPWIEGVLLAVVAIWMLSRARSSRYAPCDDLD